MESIDSFQQITKFSFQLFQHRGIKPQHKLEKKLFLHKSMKV